MKNLGEKKNSSSQFLDDIEGDANDLSEMWWKTPFSWIYSIYMRLRIFNLHDINNGLNIDALWGLKRIIFLENIIVGLGFRHLRE